MSTFTLARGLASDRALYQRRVAGYRRVVENLSPDSDLRCYLVNAAKKLDEAQLLLHSALQTDEVNHA